MALARAEAPRVLAWVDVVDDLSGLEVTDEDWLPRDALPDTLRALFAEIGRTYAPALLANAEAMRNGRQSMEAVIDGQRWEQPTFPYQGKCLQWINAEYRKLDPTSQADVDRILQGTGCEAIIVESDT